MRRVFVIGAPRSGKAVLTAMLNSHSRIALMNEVNFFRFYYKRLSRYGDLSEECNRQLLFKHMRNDPYIKDNVNAGGVLPKGICSYSDILDCFMLLNAGRMRKRAEIIGSSQPDRHCLPAVFSIFPDAKVIYIMRDPRDVVCELKRARAWYDDAVLAAKRWQQSVTDFERVHMLHPESIMPVRYEDLVGNCSAVARKLMTFIGMPFEKSMLDFHRTRSAREIAGRRHSLHRLLDRGLLKGQIGLHRQLLASKDIAIIESLLFKEMQRYGYAVRRAAIRKPKMTIARELLLPFRYLRYAFRSSFTFRYVMHQLRVKAELALHGLKS